MNGKYKIRNILLASLWIVLGGASVFLLVAAIKGKESHLCKGIEVNIKGVNNNFFVDEADIKSAIKAQEKTNPIGKAIGAFNLKKMENELEKNIWIKSAELFFNNNDILQVVIHEREPIARIFTTNGTTFYIDADLDMLPLSDKLSARVPVFTGFPSDKKVLTHADSTLLKDIMNLSIAIQKDSFSMAMIEQVDINSQRIFEMVPKIGNQLIVFGDAKNIEEKLNKIKLFYANVIQKSGWDNYSVIDVQYANQVVAKIKGATDIVADSLHAKQLMQWIAERAEKQAEDSLQTIQPDNEHNTVDSTMIQQSIQRDDNDEATESNPNPVQPVINTSAAVVVKQSKIEPAKTDNKAKQKNKPSVVKNSSKTLLKPVTTKKPVKQPKVVMPPKNDY